MARIPIPEYRQTQVPGGAPPMPREQGVQVTAGGAEGLHALGQAAQDAILKFQADNTKLEVDDAYNSRFSPAFREQYAAYYGLQGKDAVDQRPAYEAKMQELRTQVRDSLTNDAAKHEFDSISRHRVESEFDGMARHAAVQRQAWLAKTSDATLDNYSRDAADKSNDETQFAGALQSGLAEVDRYGRSTGQSSETMRARGEAFVSKAWTQRIERVMLNDPINARDMYSAHQTEIDAATRPVLEHKLKAAIMPVHARIAADYIMTGADMADLSRAIQTSDGNLLRVVERAQADAAQEAPTKAKDTRAMLASWIASADTTARKMYPDNPLFSDMVVGVVKGRVATIVQAQDAVQKQAQEQVFQVINERAPKSVDVLLRDPRAADAWVRLDEQTKYGFITKLKADAEGEPIKTNPRVMQDVFDRIHADEADPRKIRSATELASFMGHGLSFSDYTRLQHEYDRAQTPEGNAFLKSVQSARHTMRVMLKSSPIGQVMGDVAEEAAYRASMDLDAKIEAYRKAGKDPRDLLTPGKPDYALTPERLNTFMPNPRAAVSDSVAKAKADAANYKVGQVYEFNQGRFKYKGGDPKLPSSFEAVK